MNTAPPKPRGWYLAADVAQLVGVPARRIGQWATHGYIKATRDEGPPQVFSYQDVAEAMMVHLLIDRGVPRKEIRATVLNTRDKYGDWPLTSAPLGIYQGERGARTGLKVDEGTYDIGRSIGTQLFVPGLEDLQRIADLLRRGGWAILGNPQITHVEVDPEKLSGKPTILGRRLAVADVAPLAMEKGGRRELREDYGLTGAEIDDAKRWWQAVAEFQKAA